MKRAEAIRANSGLDGVPSQVGFIVQPSFFKTSLYIDPDLYFDDSLVLDYQFIGFFVNVGAILTAFVITFCTEAAFFIDASE